ncbi:MAG: transporter permease [Ferruginibacter sp.]|nr:transporter permease [Ferruginibacter sp.]
MASIVINLKKYGEDQEPSTFNFQLSTFNLQPASMFKNYFKIIVRNLWRNKLYTLINIVGLGIGIAAIVWGIQNYRFSFSYDNFHKDSNGIFRVLTKAQGSENLRGGCPLPLALAAKNDFSAVTETVRWQRRGLDIKADQTEPFESGANFTDPSFFNFFNFPLVAGSVNLNDRSTVVITEKAALKFFGTADPIGKTLLFYSDEPFKKPLTVTGILKNPPVNSSIQFELITHFDNLYKPGGDKIENDEWGFFGDAIFVKLSQPAAAAKLANDFKKYLPLAQTARKDVKLGSFVLEPLSQVANHNREMEGNALYERPQDSAAYGPIILSILILLSACLNFANTSVTQSNRRLKEMGVRKVMGSSRRNIMIQQLLECAFIVMMAILLSVVINYFWLPAFNAMFIFVDITANYFNDHILLAFLAIILVTVTLLAGAYPAFYISRFNPANIFGGSVKFGGSNLFSRVLLGFQIVISFITVIAGVAFARNSEFQRTYDFGYDKANIIGVNFQNESEYIALRDELGKVAGIDKMEGTRDQVGFSYRGATLEAKDIKKTSKYLETGENYLEVMNLKLVAGAGFSACGKAGYGKSMLINEKLAFEFGWSPTEAIGKQIRKDDSTICSVVGVLKDFTQNTLFSPMEPVAMRLVAPEKYSQIIIRAKKGELTKVYAQTKAAWAKLYPMKTFRVYYQDEVAAEASRTCESIATIFFWFAIISVLMAATGMFALVSLSVMKRMREIAIRKVVGANEKHIFQLVLKGYTFIFGLATIMGCYAGYTLSKLLMDMIFRINAGVSIGSLVASLICVLLISAATIGSRVRYAVLSKATDVLKAN